MRTPAPTNEKAVSNIDQNRTAINPMSLLQRKEPVTNPFLIIKGPQTSVNTQFKSITQLQPVGTGPGTDNDRNSIKVSELVGDEKVETKSNSKGASVIISNFIVDNLDGHDKLLKHYMVIKSGTSKYQFPVKHVYDPRPTFDNKYEPNARKPRFIGHRAGQPEGFGGNSDFDIEKPPEKNLAEDRTSTLEREYSEENQSRNGATIMVERSKKFASAFGAGTLSIANTNADLVAGANPHNVDKVKSWGEAEMAGTVVIDCGDLIAEELVDDELEQEIGRRIQVQRDLLFTNTPTLNAGGARKTESIFAKQGGILAHLLGLVKEDIQAQRLKLKEPGLKELDIELNKKQKENEGHEHEQMNALEGSDRTTKGGGIDLKKIATQTIVGLGLAFVLFQLLKALGLI